MPLLLLLLAVAPTTFVNDHWRRVQVDLYTGDAVWTGCVLDRGQSCVLLAEGEAQVKLSGGVSMSAFGHVGAQPRVLHIGARFEDGPAILAGGVFLTGLFLSVPVVLVGLALANAPTALVGAGIFLAGTSLAFAAMATAPPPAGYLLERRVEQKRDAVGVQVSF